MKWKGRPQSSNIEDRRKDYPTWRAKRRKEMQDELNSIRQKRASEKVKTWSNKNPNRNIYK